MGGLVQDIRYALRQLRKSPGFTAVAVITLALGIGANTAIFTVVNALLLEMLPVKNPQQLVVVGDPSRVNSRYGGSPRVDIFSYLLYKDLRDRNSVFTALAAGATDDSTEINTGQATPSDDKTTVRMVSGNYFSLLGLEPAAGRLFSSSDETQENANPLVVIGHAYWRHKFAFSKAIIGKQIHLNGYPFTVVGVAPSGFDGDVVGQQMDLYVPLTMQPEIVRGRHWLNMADDHWLSLIGRLKPNLTIAQAEANVNVVFQQAVQGDYGAALSSDDRNAIRDLHLRIPVVAGEGGLSKIRNVYRMPLLVLTALVGLVLLIACVNVASLLLARASTRNREIAMRLAIGASRRRILQQLLVEDLLLGLCGGLAGCLFATWGVRVLLSLLGSGTVLNVLLNARVLGFASAVSLLTVVLFGIVPGLRALRVQLLPSLNDASRSTPGTRSRFGWGKGLITGQIALAVLVLFAASLLVRSFQNLMALKFGYDRDHLIIAKLDPISAGYSSERMKLLAERLANQLTSTPQVRAVTYSTNGLFGGSEQGDAIIVPGFKPSSPQGRVAMEDYVGPDYFRSIGVPLVAGREIETQDTETSTRVAVVNEAMVQYFFAGQNPIGRQFKIDDPDWVDKSITIIGISRDDIDHATQIHEKMNPRFYLAYQQMPDPIQIIIEVRVGGDLSAVMGDIRKQIEAAAPAVPLSFIKSLDLLLNESAANQIALAKMSSFFAGLALMLACIGLYGVMAYTVASRTREIGVRIALGAKRSDIARLITRESLLIVSLGIVIGLPLALLSSRVLRSLLFGLSSADPLSLIAVVPLLGFAAGLASFVPARRAAKVDPMVALRYE
jgi:predicted permease